MRSFSRWFVTLCASPIGVVVLAALDSTLFFSLPFGIDAAVVLLSARLHALAWIVPPLAMLGSVAGAWLTFWMGVKIGERGLHRFVDGKRLRKIRRKVGESGAVALAVLDFIPPPFPFTAFVLAAGALEVHTATFFGTLAVVRTIRFGVEAALAVRYGDSILRWMDSDLFHDVVAFFMITAALLTGVSIVNLIRSTRSSRAARAGRGGRRAKTSDRRSGRRVPA